MSKITKPLLLDDTGKEIVDALKKIGLPSDEQVTTVFHEWLNTTGGQDALDNLIAEATEASARAIESATSASASAQTATEKANIATEKAEQLVESEVYAKQYRDEAEEFANSALSSKDASATSEANAKVSEENAKLSETNAQQSVYDAQGFANIAGMKAESAVDSAAKAESALSRITSVMSYRGSVPTYNDLPTNAVVGDFYNVNDTGANYTWTGTEWDETGSVIDVSGKADKDEVYTKSETYNKEEVDAAIEAGGKVKTVNGEEPDENGNIELNLQSKLSKYLFTRADWELVDEGFKLVIEGKEVIDVYALEDGVYKKTTPIIHRDEETTTVYSQKVFQGFYTSPTDLLFPIPVDKYDRDIAETYATKLELENAGKVKTVNNIEPDENGNINVDMSSKADKTDVYTKTEVNSALNTKLSKFQGEENAGKTFKIDEFGNTILSSGGGHLIVDEVPEATEAEENVVYFNEVDDAHEVLPPVEISVPVGTILPWFVNDSNPIGFIDVPNGTPLSKSAYTALFNVYGYKYTPEAEQGGDLFYLPNPYGRFLEGNEVAGEYKEAGLPNIEGSTYSGVQSSNQASVVAARGAMTFSPSENKAGSNGAIYMTGWLGIDASRSSSIYGNSDTVQPASLTVRYIVKAYDTINYDTNDISIAQLADSVNDTSVGLVGLASRTDVVAQGDGYIRYANGLQICYGGTNYASNQNVNFAMPFINNKISISQCSYSGVAEFTTHSVIDNTYFTVRIWRGTTEYTNTVRYVDWIAIGKWK